MTECACKEDCSRRATDCCGVERYVCETVVGPMDEVVCLEPFGCWADVVECDEHGSQRIVESGTSTGFTGAPVPWVRLSCGCASHDDSQDTLARVR